MTLASVLASIAGASQALAGGKPVPIPKPKAVSCTAYLYYANNDSDQASLTLMPTLETGSNRLLLASGTITLPGGYQVTVRSERDVMSSTANRLPTGKYDSILFHSRLQKVDAAGNITVLTSNDSNTDFQLTQELATGAKVTGLSVNYALNNPAIETVCANHVLNPADPQLCQPYTLEVEGLIPPTSVAGAQVICSSAL